MSLNFTHADLFLNSATLSVWTSRPIVCHRAGVVHLYKLEWRNHNKPLTFFYPCNLQYISPKQAKTSINCRTKNRRFRGHACESAAKHRRSVVLLPDGMHMTARVCARGLPGHTKRTAEGGTMNSCGALLAVKAVEQQHIAICNKNYF
jgi:hypothetical protein